MSPEKKSLIENKDVQMFNKNIHTISYYRENNANPYEDFERMSDNEEDLSKDDSFYKRSGKFQITKKKSTTCIALESSKKARRKKICQQKAALESCPGICNMKCTCKDKKTFKFNKKKYKCKKTGREGQPQCNDTVNEKNKVSDLCPKKCGTCYESE